LRRRFACGILGRMEPLSRAVARVRTAARKAYDLRAERLSVLSKHPLSGAADVRDVRDARDVVTVSKRRKLPSWERASNAKFLLDHAKGAEVLAWANRVVELDDGLVAAWEEFEAAQKAALALAFGADAPLFGLEWDAGFATEVKP
jgi:hypothetical protein